MVKLNAKETQFVEAIKDTALAWYAKKTVAEQITEHMEQVQQSILDTLQPGYSEKLTPDNTYRTLSDEDAEIYHAACKQYVAEGPYHVDNPDWCPKLLAQNALIHHETELVKAISKGIGAQDMSSWLHGKKRKDMIELSLRAFNALFDVPKDLDAVAKEMDKYLKPDQQQRMRKELNLC